MLTKLLAASVLAAGLATSAMAQNASDPADTEAGMAPGSGRSVVIDPGPDRSEPGRAGCCRYRDYR